MSLNFAIRIMFFVIANLFYRNTFSQRTPPIVHDSSDAIIKFIDFSKIDTVSLWNYELDLKFRGYTKDSIYSPIGRISFFRSQYIVDYWNQNRRPYIRYHIYQSNDSLVAIKYSSYIKSISSCFLLRGGEILKVGNYILVNSDVCNGFIDKAGNEVCRPLVDHLLSQISTKTTLTISEFFKQLPIQQSTLQF